MNLRVDEDGRAVAAGAQIEIGGNDRYISLCRRHFMERIGEAEARQLPPQPRRRLTAVMHGWLIIDKPVGPGSTDIVAR